MTIIAHAAAFTDEDVVPFEHGVALARASGARFHSIHARQSGDADRSPLDAGDVLRRWGDSSTVLEAETTVHDQCDDPVDTLLHALSELAPDLVIAATRRREGIARVLVGSRAEAIAQNVSVPTLLIPVGIRGFVSADSGEIRLDRILVPIGDDAEAKAAVEAAVAFSRLAGAPGVELVLLHVGEPDATPDVTLPDVSGWEVRRDHVGGGKKLEDAILEAAEAASLVVMATRGHDSVGDVLRGSHTDRVLHRASCPVLSVPVVGLP